MLDPIRKCPICGKPYQVFSMMVDDQSVYRECREAARKAVQRRSTFREAERRRRYFGDGR